MTRYHMGLLALFAAVWIWGAIRPLFPHDWLLENYLVFFFVPVLIGLGHYFRLSDTSYTLITLFLILHVIGSHYTYAEVPFGYTLQGWLGGERNLYDRMVHFSFGLMLAYPVREVFLRVAKVRGFWGYYLPLDVTLSFSAVYEIMEWLVAARVSPEAGMAFLGTQGDIWDAQKDMLMAGLGAALAMTLVALLNWRFNPAFASEFKNSFRLAPGDRPLGEVKMAEWWGKKKQRGQ